MADINNVTIIGRLTRDAELAYTSSGMAIATFSVAIDRSVKKGDGYEKEANFFDVKLYGKQAESLKQYLTKGKQVGVQGYLRQERWERDGQKQSKVVINANDVQLLGGRDSNHQQAAGGYEENGGYGYGN